MEMPEFIALMTFTGTTLAVAVIVAKMFSRWLSYRERRFELSLPPRPQLEIGTDSIRIDEIEARLRVLERIATESGTRLAAEIEDLRKERSLTQ